MFEWSVEKKHTKQTLNSTHKNGTDQPKKAVWSWWVTKSSLFFEMKDAHNRGIYCQSEHVGGGRSPPPWA